MKKIQKIGVLIGLIVLLSACTSSKGWRGQISPSFGLGQAQQIGTASTKLLLDEINLLMLELTQISQAGEYQLQGQFQNNSPHTIRWLNLDLLLNGETEETLSFYFTILPGQNSPIIKKDVGPPTSEAGILNRWGEQPPTSEAGILNRWGEQPPTSEVGILNHWGEQRPMTLKGTLFNHRHDILTQSLEYAEGEQISSIEIRSLSVEYIASNQVKYYYHYDETTQSEYYSENGPFVCETPPFEVEDLHLQELKLIDDEIHQIFYMSAYLKNNSIFKLSEITYTYLLPNGTTDSLSTYQRLFPGERSSKVYAEGPSSLNPDDLTLLKITYTIDGEEEDVHVEYDVVLDCYQVHHQ